MQKASIKLLLKNNKKNALGKYPIYLRITANRKTTFVSTGHFILKHLWDEKNEMVKPSHALHEQINHDIIGKKKRILDDLFQASIDKRFKSAAAIKQVVSEDLKSIFNFSRKLIEDVTHRRSPSTISNYKKHLKLLKEFAGQDISFDMIDPDYLRSFETWLRGKIKSRKEDSSNYIAAIMRTIRGHFNEAISRGITSNYPFNKYKLPNETPGNKDFLSLKELKKWHEFTFETDHPIYKEVALYFLFGCYTGLRLSDWKDFVDAKVKERNISLKAAKNKAWVAVPLHDGLIEVIKRMKVVPYTLKEPTVNRNLKKIAKHLKIDKQLSTHCARKTFSITMCLDRGVSSETTAKLMGITLAVFEKNYSFITASKIEAETKKAWSDLF